MKLLSIKEVCEALGVGRDKLKDLETAGEIPKAILIGSHKKWDESELSEFLKERRKETV